LLAAFTLAVASGCGASVAQSYEFRQGYIFAQRYVERISLSQAEKIANIPKLFEPLMSFDWTKRKEEIKDRRVSRMGNRLVLTFTGGGKLSLKNFSTKQGDGDSQLFKYIKSIPGYHIVGVEYGHDQPQFLLISESGSRIYFVNTSEVCNQAHVAQQCR
jgi:hypothetical protein